MFGIDDILIGAAISGAMSYFGGEKRNDAQVDVASQANQFNAEQAQLSRDFSAGQAQRSMDFSGGQAQKAMDFSERMSSTQWQRGVSDMMSAGLNPMLAYSQGGASSPSGSMGSGAMGSSSAATSHMPQMEDSIGKAAHSAMDAAKLGSEIDERRQNMRIKQPLEKVAEGASTVIGKIEEVIAPAGRALSEVVSVLQDKLEAGNLTSAAKDKVESLIETARVIGRGVEDRIVAPTKELVKGTSSAWQASQRRAGVAIHGERGVAVPESRGKVPREAQARRPQGPWRWDVR